MIGEPRSSIKGGDIAEDVLMEEREYGHDYAPHHEVVEKGGGQQNQKSAVSDGAILDLPSEHGRDIEGDERTESSLAVQ